MRLQEIPIKQPINETLGNPYTNNQSIRLQEIPIKKQSLILQEIPIKQSINDTLGNPYKTTNQ